ncbi:DNA-binding response regulator [Eisenbergiella tayi]|uniref:Stage 0 sporulation protein A homolog n=1 Tax=Eisenbergiella tayi TaxID=1432052 RepID=A0A1E3A7P4_9FIRM|nr:response regulator transcription factor [Eisenbergiella tayi]ODM04421.1 Transcriptional regulatory protein SrrA [Eisenbergiella tayi]ODR53545.1 DNA-binding response regulator [Eisenbergiella tayi]
MKNKILVIEDDADINTLLKKILERAGYEAETAFSGTEGRLLLKLNTYDLVLLDLMLPGLSGEELLTEIRKTLRMPVIALTAKAGLSDKVNVLGSGADDYITKPFEKQELLARIQAQLRRAGDYSAVQADASSPQKLTCRELELYPENHRVLLRGEEIPLTTHEFLLLQLLMANPQKVFSRENLYQSVWNSDFYGEDNAVSVHISNIRKKLTALTDEEYIQTVWGIGYKINL